MLQRSISTLLFSAIISVISVATPSFSKTVLPADPFSGGSKGGNLILSQKEPTPQPPSTPAPSPNCDPETETALPNDQGGYDCIKGNLIGVIWEPKLPEPDPIPTIKFADNKSANDDEELTPVYKDKDGLPPAPTTPNNLFILAHRGSGRIETEPDSKSKKNSYFIFSPIALNNSNCTPIKVNGCQTDPT